MNHFNSDPNFFFAEAERIKKAKEFVAAFLKKYDIAEQTQDNVDQALRVVAMLQSKFQEALLENHQQTNQTELLEYMMATLYEAHGNFRGIFQTDLTWDTFMSVLEGSPDMIKVNYVDPLTYYQEIANGLSPKTPTKLREVIEKLTLDNSALAEQFESDDPHKVIEVAQYIVRSELFYYFVEEEMNNQDRDKGYDHRAVTLAQLDVLNQAKELPPAFVGAYTSTTNLFDGKNQIILDGTHRALACVLARRHQYVMELDMDSLLQSAEQKRAA